MADQLEQKAKQAAEKLDELSKLVTTLQQDQSKENNAKSALIERLKNLRDVMVEEEKQADVVCVERDKVCVKLFLKILRIAVQSVKHKVPLNSICEEFPQSFGPLCQTVIEKYGTLMILSIAQEKFVDPLATCRSAGACH